MSSASTMCIGGSLLAPLLALGCGSASGTPHEPAVEVPVSAPATIEPVASTPPLAAPPSARRAPNRRTHSISGKYTVSTEHRDSPHGVTNWVIVRRVADGNIVASIDPNPGGIVNDALQVQFVAGDNLLTSWGCGTYCISSVLHRVDGSLVTYLEFYDVSPSATLAVSYPAFDAPLAGSFDLVDLRTGAVVASEDRNDAWNTCHVEWGETRVIFHQCDTRTRSVALSLPRGYAP